MRMARDGTQERVHDLSGQQLVVQDVRDGTSRIGRGPAPGKRAIPCGVRERCLRVGVRHEERNSKKLLRKVLRNYI
jgi:hypothetical protein